ncbi:MAG: CAP domain-containing protein [Actinomycetota bacterium]|nr:CAP domain-containing protein [Actinomycetota bacterium]
MDDGAFGPSSASASRRLAVGVTPRICTGAGLRPNSTNATAVDTATACLINRVRVTFGLHPLRINHYLQGVANGQVKLMVRWNYFADVRPSGQTPAALIASTRYAKHAASLSTGENIGWAAGSDDTPASMVGAWMQSPAHRAVILAGGFHDFGVGVAPALPSVLQQSERGSTYAVEFAARAS